MISKASIIICTFNRSKILLDTLLSLDRITIPEGIDWEILIIDNNSTDNTKKIVNGFIKNGRSRFKYLFDKRQGKTFALNMGITEARGDILAFTDDDAVVDNCWLKKIIETFEIYDADCVGGKSLPIWLGERPGWLSDNLLNVLGILDYGEKVLSFDEKISEGMMLFGVNWAFKKGFFLKNGLFNTQFGSRGEDQEMFDRLKRMKAKVIYNPEIIVRHKIEGNRLVKSYFRNWFYESGVAMSMLQYQYESEIIGIPRWMIRRFLHYIKDYVFSVAMLNKKRMLFSELKLIYYFALFYSNIKRTISK